MTEILIPKINFREFTKNVFVSEQIEIEEDADRKQIVKITEPESSGESVVYKGRKDSKQPFLMLQTEMNAEKRMFYKNLGFNEKNEIEQCRLYQINK